MSSLMLHPVPLKNRFQIHFLFDKQNELTNQFPSNDSN